MVCIRDAVGYCSIFFLRQRIAFAGFVVRGLSVCELLVVGDSLIAVGLGWGCAVWGSQCVYDVDGWGFRRRKLGVRRYH